MSVGLQFTLCKGMTEYLTVYRPLAISVNISGQLAGLTDLTVDSQLVLVQFKNFPRLVWFNSVQLEYCG